MLVQLVVGGLYQPELLKMRRKEGRVFKAKKRVRIKRSRKKQKEQKRGKESVERNKVAKRCAKRARPSWDN